MVVLVNTSEVLYLDHLKSVILAIVPVVSVVLRVFHHSLVLVITVTLVILLTLIHLNFIPMIQFGMDKDVVVLRYLVVIDPIFFGFISHWGTVQLTLLK